MRNTSGHQRRREQFMADVLWNAILELHLDGDAIITNYRITPSGSKHGATLVEATAVVEDSVWDLDHEVLAQGFGALWLDRRDHGHVTQLERVSTAWRDRMLQARSVNDATSITRADALKILRLGMEQTVEA